MTERLDPTRPYGDRRQQDRRREDRVTAQAPPEAAALPVPVSGVQAHEHTSPPPLDGQAAFAAQLLGQPGVKRGLKQPGTVETARSAYLEAEYSGPADRRPPKGLIKKTAI
ncbi:MAG: hypothetical protein EON95_16405 [Caulobacteraceae bacterium]|nr:MAG: hypothetical protein EON95_16405 [Caulobacteraceae bacterium]